MSTVPLNPIEVFNKKTFSGYGEYVGRPGPLGNPYTHMKNHHNAPVKVKSRAEAIQRCDEWLDKALNEDTPQRSEFARLLRIYQTTGSLRLLCWCEPLPCHARLIAKRLERAAGRKGR